MLLAFDLDKTILTGDYELPEPIRAAILQARRAGHFITVLTGRPEAAAQPYLEALEIDEYYSTNHGSLVIGAAGSVLQQKRLQAEEVSALLEDHLETDELAFSSILNDVLYVRDPGDARWDWAHTLNRQVRRFDPDANLEADKLVFSVNGSGAHLAKDIARRYPDFVLYHWDEGYLEVTAAKADKGTGLALLAETLAVPQKDTVAFGDGPNDVTMLAWAHRSVAVGPAAHRDVLAVADEHIAAPEDLGVARWLEQNLL